MNIELLAPPVSSDDIAALNSLLRQLSPTTRESDQARIDSVLQRIASNNGGVYVVRNEQGAIIATATLLVVETLQKHAGIIEDVVVDEISRHKGIGSGLMDFVIEQARALKLDRLELTSLPTRQAANNLYQKEGFQRRDTNCYILKLK